VAAEILGHVVRDNNALLAIREYIRQNQQNWRFDSQNPEVAHLYQLDGSET
jgi:hypothetical protein